MSESPHRPSGAAAGAEMSSNNLTGLGRVVTVGLLLVLATWWLTYFKRRRRQRHVERVADSVSRHPATVSADAVDQ